MALKTRCRADCPRGVGKRVQAGGVDTELSYLPCYDEVGDAAYRFTNVGQRFTVPCTANGYNLLTHSIHISPSTYVPVYYAHCLFPLLLLFIISTAHHLLSGSQAARLLLN